MISLMASDWSKLINDEKSSDVIIVVKNKSYHCHKTILSMHSEYFQQKFANWDTDRVVLDDLPCANSMSSILRFMYNQPVTIKDPIHFANMYYTANYLMIDVIKEKLMEMFLKDIECKTALRILLYYQDTNRLALDDIINFCSKQIRNKMTNRELNLLYELDLSIFAGTSFEKIAYPVHYVYKMIMSNTDREQFLKLLSLINFNKIKYSKPEIILKAFLILNRFVSMFAINEDEMVESEELDLIQSYADKKNELYITILERIVKFDPFMAELDVDHFVELISMFPREQHLHLGLTFYKENIARLQLKDCQKLFAVTSVMDHDVILDPSNNYLDESNNVLNRNQNPYNLTGNMIDPALCHYATLSDLPYLNDLIEYKKQTTHYSEYGPGQYVYAYDREARNGSRWIPAIIMKKQSASKCKISFLGWGSKYDTTLSICDIAPRYTKCKKRFDVRSGNKIEVLVSDVWKIGQIKQINDTNIIIQVLNSQDNLKIHVRNYEYSEMVCPYRTHILNR